jgi:O-antigen ligase
MAIGNMNTRLSIFFAAMLGISIFASVALTNLAVLGLLLTAPIAWLEFYKNKQTIDKEAKVFLGLIFALCVWDVVTNMVAGHALGASLKALLHDMRTFGFVIALWAVFANPSVSRAALGGLLASVLLLATINLILTQIGLVPQGHYFTTHLLSHLRMADLSHLYGQALVGLVFVLAQALLIKPRLSWRVALPLVLLLLSLFLASSRRTGWLLLVAGGAVWLLLNIRKLNFGKYKWWMGLAIFSLIVLVASSDVVSKRMAEVAFELQQFMSMTPQERSAAVFGSVSIRLQFAITAWEAIKQNNAWLGVGSINFPQAYQAAATSIQVTPQSWATYNWGNPHNEYLYMLATKGAIGLILYLAVFAQACRVAWQKTDELQRVGLITFVFLFMVSITTNSMMIDMEEGHLTLLVLLAFLAPKVFLLPRGDVRSAD